MTSATSTNRSSVSYPSKTAINVTDSMRRNRILTPQQCTDNRAKLANIRNLAAAADREYRTMLAELDRLDRDGRGWLVVDLIHKTSLASLDLAASLLGTINPKGQAEALRILADGTQTASDMITGFGTRTNDQTPASEQIRTAAGRILTHEQTKTAGGAFAKGKADTILSLWNGYENVSAAKGSHERSTRAIEASVDTIASVIQANAETIDKATPGGSKNAGRISSAAGIARAMASYNREIAGAFNRRLEIRTDLRRSRDQFEASMRPHINRLNSDAEKIITLLESCQ